MQKTLSTGQAVEVVATSGSTCNVFVDGEMKIENAGIMQVSAAARKSGLYASIGIKALAVGLTKAEYLVVESEMQALIVRTPEQIAAAAESKQYWDRRAANAEAMYQANALTREMDREDSAL